MTFAAFLWNWLCAGALGLLLGAWLTWRRFGRPLNDRGWALLVGRSLVFATYGAVGYLFIGGAAVLLANALTAN